MGEATPALNQLCLACGLCCVGVVHTRVPLAAAELSLAHKLEMQVAEFEEGPGFQLPCPQYRADRCAAYQQRPQACINYQCELLQRCCEGAVTVEDALSLVAQAKRMLNQLRVRWPDRASTPLTFDRLRRLLAEP